MRLLLLAPPGAGKGTQGQRLAARFRVRHIAAGDLLRAEAHAGGRLGGEIAAHQARGDLVPDQIVLDVLTPAVVEAAARGGYILDGFPRTLPQATAAAELAAGLGVTLQAVVYLHAPEKVLTRRLLDRASQDGRADDKADVIRHRLGVFAGTTGPLVPYYTERGILITVDADQPPESVTADIQAGLSALSLSRSRGHGSAGASARLAPQDQRGDIRAPRTVPRRQARRSTVGNWQLDPYHTQVEFSAKHLGMMTVRGQFDEVSAIADIDPDHPETSSVEVTISTASLRTNNAMRDKDIRSSNFLEVDKYPVITFKSTSVEPAGQDRYTLTGDLTIKGNTRPVSLQMTRYGEFNDEGMMGHRIAYGAQTKINRKEFGLSFNAILDGRIVVGEEIQIMIEGELVEQKEEAETAAG